MSGAQLGLDPTPAWERDMNPEQLEAIRHHEGPCALLAQAGSGKTRALVHRIARMVADGVPGETILAVTFSKKAADEMNARLKELGVESARVGTWHSLCLQILKDDQTEWASWSVDDKDRARVFMKEVVGYKFMNWGGADPTKLLAYVGLCKANLEAPGSDEALERATGIFRHEGRRAAEAYEQFQRMVEERGLLTFDDFLVFAHRHLSIEENRAQWAGRWLYVLQDEAQDENKAQVRLGALLARDHRNYMLVGDVAQCIYAFRGSKPNYMLEFIEEWGARVISMSRNYRSGSEIVRVANDVIRPAVVRLPQDMVAERGVEGHVRVVCGETLDDEAKSFVDWVYELTEGHQPLSSVCALFRTNAQSRALEDELLSRRVPYAVVGGTSFYQRKEVKDLLCYLRVAAGRDEGGEAVRRCLNAPFRYLGSAFLDRLEDKFPEGRRSTWQRALKAVGEVSEQGGVQQRQRASVVQWAVLVGEMGRAIEGEDPKAARPEALLNDLVHKTRFIEWVSKEEGAESVENSRASNVRELVRVAGKFDTAAELLDYIDETTNAAERQRRDKRAGGERVLLMSVHRSKGLEWPHVFVAGCNEGILPHAKGDPEEERRLMYVAVTRARDQLVLSHVRKFATMFGVVEAQPSRFLVDAGLVKVAAGGST